jgi:tetratricopeptide (TPR) repeat protein
LSTKKTKLLESAQKNIQKGAYARAIEEYEEIIKLDPGDIRHKQKLAELLAKANRKDEAVKEYNALGKHYVDSDHYLKAIAVYKQVQKLDPADPDTSLTLASLNEKQGLIGNAIAEYNVALQIYENNGENRKALKVLESLLLIEPKNAAIRLRSAEKSFTMGEESKALDGFTELARDLRENGDENGFNHVAERLMALFPAQAGEILAGFEETPAAEPVAPPPVATPATAPKPVEKTVPAPVPPVQSAPAPAAEKPAPPRAEAAAPAIPLKADADLEVVEDLDEVYDLAEVVEETAPPEHEWEEEIDLGSLDEGPVATVPQIAPALPTTESVHELPDLALDEIELELEIEPEEELAIEEAAELEGEALLEPEPEAEPELEIEAELELVAEPQPEFEMEPELVAELELAAELALEYETELEVEAQEETGFLIEAEEETELTGEAEPETEDVPGAPPEAAAVLHPPPVDTYDLASELSLFADELDFDLPQQDAVALGTGAEMFKTSDLDQEDAESHYSLGLAYKEMGLFDEAISEFIVASNSPARKIDCLLLQGLCHRENGDLAKAEEILATILGVPNITEDEMLSVKYELADCYIYTGELDIARRLLSEIVTLRPHFSDAASRLENL